MTQKKYTVLKFGGSSTGSAETMLKVIDYIDTKYSEGPIAIVVSAMGKTTDLLFEALEYAAKGDYRNSDKRIDIIGDTACNVATRTYEHLMGDKDPRAGVVKLSSLIGDLLDPLRRLLYGVSLVREGSLQTTDLVLSFGERLSARILTELLNVKTIPAIYVDSRDWTITDNTFGKGVVDWEISRNRVLELEKEWGNSVSVHTGFLGKTPDNRTTTLGRNGSDYTATLLARALDAKEVVVSTDVSGVMTADPALVDEAYPITHLTYMEALELANFGARMFHSSTMIPLIASGIPMRIKSTLDADGKGTIINAEGSGDDNQPISISSLENLAMIDAEWRLLTRPANVAARVLDALADADITVWMATQAAHGQAVSMVVPLAQLDRAKQAVETALALELDRGEVEPLDVREPVTLITLVAGAMGRTPNVAGRLFYTLGTEGIMIRAIAQGAGARSISCVIDASDTKHAVRKIHSTFHLDNNPT